MNDARGIQKLELTRLMEQASFRRFVLRLLEEAGVDHNGFHLDPHAAAYNSGARRVGFWVENELKEASPANYLLMLKEQLDG